MAGSAYTFSDSVSAATMAFKMVAVAGQTALSADRGDDTLTFAQYGPLEITTNESLDTLTISAAPLVSKIDPGTTGSLAFYASGGDRVTSGPRNVSGVYDVFWDASNKKLGIGTQSPSANIYYK